MTQPDPEFKAFFAGEWRALMDTVEVPGMQFASWDRKAAYLLWRLGGMYDAELYGGVTWLDCLKAGIGAEAEPPPKMVPYTPLVQSVGRAIRPIVGSMSPEAKQSWLEGDFVNLEEDAACQPSPGGIALEFDASKW